MSETTDSLPEDEALAAELAVGALSDDALAAAQARLAVDPAFARRHAAWLELLAERLAPPLAPRPSLWPEIAAGLGIGTLASATVPLRRLRRWQAVAGIAAMAAVASLVVATQQLTAPPRLRIVQAPAPAPLPLVAVLSGSADRAIVAVRLDPASGRLIVTPLNLSVAGHAAQLWIIPGDGKPRSMGLIAADVRNRLVAPADSQPAVAAGATLAISVEPVGGSPTGLPTGPVILSGKIATL